MNPKLKTILLNKFIWLRNIIVNGDFSNSTTGWGVDYGTLSVTSNTLSLTANGTALRADVYQTLSIPAIIGHRYYCRFKARVTNSDCLTIRCTVGGPDTILKTNPTINEWYPLSFIKTATQTYAYVIAWQYYVDIATANGKVMEINEFELIDLDVHYGEKIPTVAQMDEWYPNFFNGSIQTIVR